jgi:hypothetical protein
MRMTRVAFYRLTFWNRHVVCKHAQRFGPRVFVCQMLQRVDAQCERPGDVLIGEGVVIVAAQILWLIIELNMYAVAKLPQLMQVVVNGRAKPIE